MRGTELLDKMDLADPAYVEAADSPPKHHRPSWVRWGALAACLCLAVTGLFLGPMGTAQAPASPAPPDFQGEGIGPAYEEDEAYGFHLSGDDANWYFPISFEEWVRYGLVPSDAVGLTEENTYQITRDDLGARMGTVAYCGDETLVGCEVYHFARYPDQDAICIVDTPAGYAFYTCTWLSVEVEVGGLSDTVLSAYDLPGSLEQLEVLTPDLQPLFTAEGDAAADILALLSGKVNIGLEANERRFAQAWYDAYGDRRVYYSEETGVCVYTDIALSDTAHALWTEGERVLRITTAPGYQLVIDYFPSISTFQCGDGYYELRPEEVEALNALLRIS